MLMTKVKDKVIQLKVVLVTEATEANSPCISLFNNVNQDYLAQV